MTQTLTLTKKQISVLINWSEKKIDRKAKITNMPQPKQPDKNSPSIYWLRQEIEEWVKNWPERGL